MKAPAGTLITSPWQNNGARPPRKKRTKPVAERVAGVCIGLGCSAILPQGRKCLECVDCKRKRVKDSEDKWDPAALKARRAASNKRAYKKNPQKMRERARVNREKLREEMLAAYGGKCTCCGEKEKAFLTLEHKKRDGKAHRMRLSGGRNNSWSQAVYLDLKRRGWPKRDYTILCFNCNHAEWKLGMCPHRRRKK